MNEKMQDGIWKVRSSWSDERQVGVAGNLILGPWPKGRGDRQIDGAKARSKVLYGIVSYGVLVD